MNRDLVIASEIATFNEVKRNQYDIDMMNEMDYAQIREDAEVKGYVRGQLEGKAEGKAESKADIAKAMLANGLSIEMACKCTGLTPELIKSL